MFGGTPRALQRTDSFAALVDDAINASSLTELAARWGVAEETIRNWRDHQMGPNWKLLIRIRFSDEERIRLLRLLSTDRLRVEPKSDYLIGQVPPTLADGRRHEPAPHDVYGATGAVLGEAHGLQQSWHDALADGVVDPGEQASIERANDRVVEATRQTRPGFFARLKGMIAPVGSARVRTARAAGP